jgi:KaiC/GvpD/RAD55 family RecA-like ATPase
MADRIPQFLQENLITILAHSHKSGKIVASLVTPDLFDGDYQLVADRCISFWQRHGEPPGAHVPDLMDDILQDKAPVRSRAMRNTILHMLQLARDLNEGYVLDQIQKFIRLQAMKRAVLQSAEALNAQQDMALDEVEQVWNELLRSRTVSFDPGKGLGDVSAVLAYMDRRSTEFTLGVPLLTRRGIVPARGAVLLFIAAPKTSKSWFCVHVGKYNALKQHKVLHVSLEMSEEQVIQRYYQNLFSVPRRYGEVQLTKFATNDSQEVSGWDFETIRPEFGLDSPVLRDELEVHVEDVAERLDLRVKRWPPRALSIGGLQAYLDALEISDKFVPDLIIIDSPYLMKMDTTKDYRIALGRNLEHVRALAVERNLAIVATHQLSRPKGSKKKEQDSAVSNRIAEDWSLVQTADTVVSFSRTDTEKKFNLGRLYVEHCRDEEDRFELILTQNLAIGQWHLSSVLVPNNYWKIIEKEATTKRKDEDKDDNDPLQAKSTS